ncbi:MAG: ATP-binding protein [Planctomycetaceae bacterium]|jgi:AAA15 family ATPase/GTPase|nr:ATP-binding protein [Planctomycetaceae bacterium]
MQRIKIKNFGPIRQVEFNVNDYTVFIGEQASGKSTIARFVYFFLSLKDEIKSIIYNNDGSAVSPLIERWKECLIVKFNQYWDRTFWQDDTQIKFFLDGAEIIDDSKFIEFSFRNGFPDVLFSASLTSAFNQYADTITSKSEKSVVPNSAVARFVLELIELSGLNDVLSDSPVNYEYIPAGRTIFSVLRNELNPDISFNDILLSDFILTTNYIRRELTKQTVEEHFQNARQIRDSESPKNLIVAEEIYKYANRVLHGKYRYENNTDFICTDSGKNFPLLSSSSGQREAIWILYNILFYVIRGGNSDSNSLFAVIEEPESHLFPESQRNIMFALTLFANHIKNRLMLTTHSPYILTPLSNLLYAFTLGQDKTKRNSVAKIIDPNLWIDPRRFECYYVDNGTIESVMDRKTNIINLDKLDMTSVAGNEDFDKLLDIENW